MGFVVASVLADELLGVIVKADPKTKKITVLDKNEKEVEVTITDDTEVVTKKGTSKFDFEKIEKGIERAKEKGGKGVSVKITHEKAVASKIEYQQKKKAVEKKEL
jgi:signal transduction histidine kinase